MNEQWLLKVIIEVSGLFIDLYHERVESTRKIVCDRDFESCKNDFEGMVPVLPGCAPLVAKFQITRTVRGKSGCTKMTHATTKKNYELEGSVAALQIGTCFTTPGMWEFTLVTCRYTGAPICDKLDWGGQ